MIHTYTMLGNHIALDVYSGAVHCLDGAAFALVKYYEKNGFEPEGLTDSAASGCPEFSEEELKEAYGELLALYRDGQLFSNDIYEGIAKNYQKKGSVVKALCLHVAHTCNLRCRYCFADEGAFGGPKGVMSAEVGKAAIDFVIQNSGNRRNIEVDFFGGEPLMNFDAVKEIVEYAESMEDAHQKHFRFTITTNGVLLNDEIIDYCNQHMSNIVLSIDGRKEVNDKMRPAAGGNSVYEELVPKFLKVAESRNQDNYYVRGTFTRHNLDFPKDIRHLADLGFQQISVEPVVAPEEADYAIREEDVERICREYETFAEEYFRAKKSDKPYHFFHFMIDLEQGPCVYKRMSGCGSGTEYLAVTPEGDIYPCHQFVGQKEFKMGNVLEGCFDRAMTEQFDRLNVYTKEECKNCWAKFYCSGGCAANAWNFNQDLTKPYEIGCRLQRKRTECAIAVKVAQMLEEQEGQKEG